MKKWVSFIGKLADFGQDTIYEKPKIDVENLTYLPSWLWGRDAGDTPDVADTTRALLYDR